MFAFRASRRLLIAPSRPLHMRYQWSAQLRPNPSRGQSLHPRSALSRYYNTTTPRFRGPKRDGQNQEDKEVSPQFEKKPHTRSSISKSNLRRIATNDRNKSPASAVVESRFPTQICTAYCTAEKYNLNVCNSLLKAGGYVPDPLSTGLGDEVIHLRLPLPPQACRNFPNLGANGYGDIFIFHSGNIVSWGIAEAVITSVAALIKPAAEGTHATTETETLEFLEDPTISSSFLRGDVITIGTSTKQLEEEHGDILRMNIEPEIGLMLQDDDEGPRRQGAPTVLAKIAFSSGLARSTKLAVLESLLESYIESTSDIPVLLSQGSRLPFTRDFILRKTGELLSFRARLNLYSELTDSLPDIFWDSRRELGLEGYYESVGRELDVGVRIRQLNEKLDYANETAAVLRERLSERHGLVLEWMIIILITIEVAFEFLHLWKDSKKEERREEIEIESRGQLPVTAASGYRSYPRTHPHEYQQPHKSQPYYTSQQEQAGGYSRSPSNRMDDVDAALVLLDNIISRLNAEEEQRRLENTKGDKR